MKTILGYILTPLYHVYFGLMLVLFHPVQVAARHLFGDGPRKKTVDVLNTLLVRGLVIMGARIRFSGFEKIPSGRPLIIVSNHQSLYDIPPVVVGFKKYYPRFISKKELSRNLPSISYNLRYAQSALIDRKKGTQAVKEIFRVGQLIEKNRHAVCIFPEGTRSKTGQVGKFMPGGIHTLLRAAPSAVIVPFVIDGHSALTRKGLYPLQFGQKITYTVLEPIEPTGLDVEDLVDRLHQLITASLRPS